MNKVIFNIPVEIVKEIIKNGEDTTFTLKYEELSGYEHLDLLIHGEYIVTTRGGELVD